MLRRIESNTVSGFFSRSNESGLKGTKCNHVLSGKCKTTENEMKADPSVCEKRNVRRSG